MSENFGLKAFSIIAISDGGYFVSGILDVTASDGKGNNKTVQKQHTGGVFC